MRDNLIIIAVTGGIAEVVSAPPGFEIEIRDYDVIEERENVRRDENGEQYAFTTISTGN